MQQDVKAYKSKSMTALTYELLREGIVTAQYKPGERLRIDMLCQEHSVSSGAVREALSRLTAEGLAVAEPQKGFIVSPISKKDLIDLTEVRVKIELVCLEQSMRNGDAAWEGRLLSASHQLSRLSSYVNRSETEEARRWHQLHEAFHYELTSACGNDWWLRLRKQLYAQSERYRRLTAPFAENDRDIDAEHRAIVEAVIARDVDLAKARLSAHLRMTTEILLNSRIPFAEG